MPAEGLARPNIFKDFADQLKETADPVVEEARSSITNFAEYVMRDPQGRPIRLKPFHRQMLEAVVANRFVVISAFRGSGKSQLMSVCYPLWLMMRDRDVRIMIVTASDSLSKEWLRHIESYLNSPQYIKLAGNLIPGRGDGLVWTNEVKVIKGRSKSAAGATLLALGVHGQIRGRRADVVIADDLESESNSHTSYQRAVLSHWFHGAVIPTLDHVPEKPLSGQAIVVGTPLYLKDLLAELQEEWADIAA